MSEPPMPPMAGDDLDATIARVVFGTDVPRPYSTDMAAAWLVVERLTAVWPWVEVQFAMERWEAEAWANAGILREAFHAAADTAPLAICRLALRALPVGQEPR